MTEWLNIHAFAKLLLEEIFPDEFKNIEIADKPDLLITIILSAHMYMNR